MWAISNSRASYIPVSSRPPKHHPQLIYQYNVWRFSPSHVIPLSIWPMIRFPITAGNICFTGRPKSRHCCGMLVGDWSPGAENAAHCDCSFSECRQWTPHMFNPFDAIFMHKYQIDGVFPSPFARETAMPEIFGTKNSINIYPNGTFTKILECPWFWQYNQVVKSFFCEVSKLQSLHFI